MPAQEPFCLSSNPLACVYPRKWEPVDFSKPQLPPWQNGHNDSPVSTHSFILSNSMVVTAAGDEVRGYYISPREQWWWPSGAHRWGTHILTSRKFTLSNCCPLTPAISGCLGPHSCSRSREKGGISLIRPPGRISPISWNLIGLQMA